MGLGSMVRGGAIAAAVRIAVATAVLAAGTAALRAQETVRIGFIGPLSGGNAQQGLSARNGFQLAVEYTAPVFWFFFLLVGVALILLRRREPDRPRPFRVPLYPLTPLLFCAVNAWLLWSSLAYTGWGALLGVAVVALGGVLLLFLRTPSTSEVSR